MWRSILFSLALALTISGCGGGGGGGGGSDSQPEQPGQPEQPAQPEQPGQPEQPAQPEQPGQPEPPDQPEPPPVTPVSNQLPVVVDGAFGSVNTPFVSVTVCSPGTNDCQTIDHVILDTGSSGLRIVSSVLNPVLSPVQIGNGRALAECMQFVSGYTWGSIRSADVKLAGHTLEGLAIQLIGDTSAGSAPASCANTGASFNTVDLMGGNGILGVGIFAQDCGASCARTAVAGAYYACSGANCQPTAVPPGQQLHNPVALLSADDNGVVVELPVISSSGASSVNGTLTLGIGTQANNSLGSATVLRVNANSGAFTTQFGGANYTGFLDSGSNGFFFESRAISACTGAYSGFYCPASMQHFTATNRGTDGATSTVSFEVDNTRTLFSSGNVAFNNLAGNYMGSGGAFDWGLPFFFGRTVFTAIEGKSTLGGTGPYIAY
jgi:hypothetical protein